MIARLVCLVALLAPLAVRGELPKRIPWTTSKIQGTPEPPHPYRIERAFANLTFRNPVHMSQTPTIPRWFICEQHGAIYSFPKDPATSDKGLFFDAKDVKSFDPEAARSVGLIYALAFHPQFAKNRYCYMCQILGARKQSLPDGSRIVRYTVTDTDPPRVDLKSEKIILTWPNAGHNGCDVQFGPDGCLYISTGDGTTPNPPDAFDTGQDISDLLGSILRIDVDRAEEGRAYAIPKDNPFRTLAGARPEIWAYGFRNPWRMSFDRVKGDLWVGDVGWELWEMVYKIKRGGNYGWSVMEGRQPVKPLGKRGPTPILPPTIEFSHTDAASITGGYVYHGKRFPDLVGAYICGDWVSRKVWATKFDGERMLWHKEIAHGVERVVGFGEDTDGELFIVNHDEKGSIHQLVPNPAAKDYRDTFPRKLSESGLFASTSKHQLAPGVQSFDVQVSQWADHATSERFLALPGTTTATMYNDFVNFPERMHSGRVYFPKDGVLGKTVRMEMERGNPKSRRNLETQILHYDGVEWHGYTYRWNDAQTDADLVEPKGADIPLTVIDKDAPGGQRKQTWHMPSRMECKQCHNPWTGYALAFNLPQLNRDAELAGTRMNQVRVFEQLGLITLKQRSGRIERPYLGEIPNQLVPPEDTQQPLDARARSYLHVNCAHCHQFGAGGSSDIDFRISMNLFAMKLIETKPVQGMFEIPDCQIVAPGDPARSALYYRMAKMGPGRMPHIGSELVDEQGLRLMQDWIRQVPAHKDQAQLLWRLRELDEETILMREKADMAEDKLRLAERVASNRRHLTVLPEDIAEAEQQWQKDSVRRKQERQSERAESMKKLLASTTGALLLMKDIEDNKLSKSIRADVLKLTAVSQPLVRDLFERFVPADQRVKRLGNYIKMDAILALKGDVEKGRALFMNAAGLQCVKCHRVGEVGSTLGPDLSGVALRMNRGKILENIVEPSKEIEPKYRTHVLETDAGEVLTGILVEKNAKEVVLRMVGDKERRIPVGSVASLEEQRTSLMPEQLLRDVTAQDAADLLEFLSGQKRK